MKTDEEIVKEAILTSLLQIAEGKLTAEQGELIVSKLKIDTENTILMHKSTQWFADVIWKSIQRKSEM